MSVQEANGLDAFVNIPADGLWNKFPKSNIYTQQQLFRNSVSAQSSVPEVYEQVLDGEVYQGLLGLAENKEASVDGVVLTAYHMLLQHYLNLEESVLGLCNVNASKGIEVRASYVYAEDDDVLEDVLAYLKQDLNSPDLVNIESPQLQYEDLTTIPAFSYCSGEPKAASLSTLITLSAQYSQDRAVFIAEKSPSVLPSLVFEQLLSSLIELLNVIVRNPDDTVSQWKSTIVGDQSVAASDTVERQRYYMEELKAIWEELLNVPMSQMNAESNYFELGGTSLNAFKLVNLVRSKFQVDLNIREIIEHDCLSSFVDLLLEKREQHGLD